MPSLTNVLAGIPGYAGYRGAQELTRQKEMDELRQASVLEQLHESQQKQRFIEREAQSNEAVRAAIAALPPEQRTRENVLPILLQHARNPREIAGMLPESKRRTLHQIGAGGLYDEGTGQVINPAEKPKEPKPPTVRQRYDGTNVVQEEQQADGTWMEIGRGPRFAPERAPAAEKPPKAPSGYRFTADGNMEPVPGGPADTKAQGVFNQDTNTLAGVTSGLDRLAVAANEVMNHPGLSGITGMRGAFPNLPGSAAANAQAKLNTLKAQVGFGVLQDMRNASRTGGALGSITEKELQFLQNALSSLENAQDAAAMKESLQKILDYTAESKVRLNNAYNMKHGDKGAAPAAPAAPAQTFREGQTATGPGGQKIIFKNGQWQPATSPQGSR